LTVALSAAAALSMAAPGLAATGPAAPAGPAGAAGASPAANSQPAHTITLLTGHVVQVTGSGAQQSARVVTDVAPYGDVHFLRAHGDLYALPGEAAPALAAGQLDIRLFDLSLLIRDGYTDEKMPQTPVIVSYTSGRAAMHAQASHQLAGASVDRPLPSLHGFAAQVDHRQAKSFFGSITVHKTASTLAMAAGVQKVWLDGKVKVADDVSRVTIGADRAWAAGDDGTGQTVAVVDTGIDATHTDLAGQVVAAQDFVPAPYAGSDSPTDRYGHGTHVASIIAGTGALSGGKYAGVAPKANLVDAKVLTDDTGAGADSWIIAGMQWAASKAKIVNMSLGGCCTDGTDPLTQALGQISASTGALFVVAAGNSGQCTLCVGAPGVADAALTVAATSRDGTSIAGYSSGGPRPGDYALKPEIAAPGSGIIAAAAKGSYLASFLDPNGTGYMPLSGTSMATPHVAGSAALVLEQHPTWTAQQIKDELISSASPIAGYPTTRQGAGLINVGRAVTRTLDATGVLNLGDIYPQPGQQLTGTITYTNTATTAATLNLADKFWTVKNGADQTWTPAAGAVTVTPTQVTVPAGGTATAKVSADVSQAPVGTVYGDVTATAADGTQENTTLDFTRDIQRFPLTATATADIDGKTPVPGYTFFEATGSLTGTWVNYPDPGQWYRDRWLNVFTGDIVTALPADTYQVSGDMGGSGHDTLIGGYTIKLNQATSFTVDGRQAHLIDVATPRPAVNDYTVFFGHIPAGDNGDTGITTAAFAGFSEYLLLGPNPQNFTLGMTTRRAPVPLVLRSTGDHPVRVGALLSRANYPGSSAQDYIQLCWSCARMLPDSGRLTLVDAGDGGPAALAGKDLRGKVALIRQGPGTDPVHETFIDDYVTAAAKAGAKGVVLAVDSGAPAPIRYADSNQPIWSTVVTQADGATLARLIGGGQRTFEATADRSYDYQLDLQAGPPPAGAVWKVTEQNLATLHIRYHAAVPITGPLDPAGWQAQSTFFDADFATETLTGLPLPSVRTEYITAGEGATIFFEGQETGRMGGAWFWIDRLKPLSPGQSLTLDPDLGPMAPGRLQDQSLLTTLVFLGKRYVYLDPNVVSPYLNLGKLLSSTNGLGGLDVETVGPYPAGTTLRTRVYTGGAQVCDSPALLAGCPLHQALTATVQYRIVADTAQIVLPNSTRTSTDWTVSVGPGSTKPPLVVAESQYPVDLYNVARGDEQQVPIHIGYQPGGPTAPASWNVKVWATYDDGTTWTPVFDGHAGPDGNITPTIRPPHTNNGYVGLRIQAGDGNGNSVDQTVIRAYTLQTHQGQ
jgi:subtilisin family serine protease